MDLKSETVSSSDRDGSEMWNSVAEENIGLSIKPLNIRKIQFLEKKYSEIEIRKFRGIQNYFHECIRLKSKTRNLEEQK